MAKVETGSAVRSLSMSRFALVTALTTEDYTLGANRAVYAFDVTTGRELWKLLSPSSMEVNFGEALAVSGSTAVIGASDRFGGSFTSGSVYVYDILTGELLQQIFPSNAHRGQEFGYRVAIDGDLALIGDRYGDNGTLQDTGSAYVFDVARSGSPATSTTTARSTPPTMSPGATGSAQRTPKPTTTPGATNFGGTIAAATAANLLGNVPEPSSPAIILAGRCLACLFSSTPRPCRHRPGLPGRSCGNQNAPPREPIAPALLARVERCFESQQCEKHRSTQTSCEGAVRSIYRGRVWFPNIGPRSKLPWCRRTQPSL